MALPTRPLTAVIVCSDSMLVSAYGAALRNAGFEVLDTFENGPLLLQALNFLDPSLLVIANDLYGMSGLEVVEDLVRSERHPEAILLSPDEHIQERASAVGILGVPMKGDMEVFERIVADAKHLFESGERRSRSDRRSGDDRRQRQDWSVVTHERRRGGDRRQGDRRTEAEIEAERVAVKPLSGLQRRK